MGLFDKKYCDICGEKIGLLGNHKLEDGNLCKNCAKKLSPWFNERRHSSVADIKAQLAYREENKQKVEQFCVTRVIGDNWNVIFDEKHRWFTVTTASKPDVNENPDIIDFSAITGCRLDIDENRNEIFRRTNDGKNESYNPPRYEYLYAFNIIINVNTPYFDEIRFFLNSGTVSYRPQPMMQGSLLGRVLAGNEVNPENCPEYCQYIDMGNEICNELNRARGINQTFEYSQSAQPNTAPVADTQAWSCVNCGAQNSGKFCESCGSPKPVQSAGSCASCGWTPVAGQNIPKFCPECGKPISR